MVFVLGVVFMVVVFLIVVVVEDLGRIRLRLPAAIRRQHADRRVVPREQAVGQFVGKNLYLGRLLPGLEVQLDLAGEGRIEINKFAYEGKFHPLRVVAEVDAFV